MVRDDHLDIAGELTRAVSQQQQLPEAVVGSRDEDRHLALSVAQTFLATQKNTKIYCCLGDAITSSSKPVLHAEI